MNLAGLCDPRETTESPDVLEANGCESRGRRRRRSGGGGWQIGGEGRAREEGKDRIRQCTSLPWWLCGGGGESDVSSCCRMQCTQCSARRATGSLVSSGSLFKRRYVTPRLQRALAYWLALHTPADFQGVIIVILAKERGRSISVLMLLLLLMLLMLIPSIPRTHLIPGCVRVSGNKNDSVARRRAQTSSIVSPENVEKSS